MRFYFRPVSALTIIACYAFYFFEWLFFITKPSMFSAMSTGESFQVLLVSPLPLLAVTLVLISIIGLLGKIPWKPFSSNYLDLAGLLIPTFVMTVTAFLLVENFTYTLFNFNAGSFDGYARYLYALVFLVLAGIFFQHLKTLLLRSFWLDRQRAITLSISVPLLISVLVALFQFEEAQPGPLENSDALTTRSPNFLILSSDGVVAKRLPAYGYHRDTTPFISSILENALVFENFFTNSEKTTGSIASLLSGRLPTTTRVLIRPDMFQGRDSFMHFPGVLQNQGYRNADISIRYYADAYDLNMKRAFDYANGRRISDRMASFHLPLSVQLSYASELRFIEITSERTRMRVLQMVGLGEMINPYDEVKQLSGGPQELYGNDIDRVASLLDFIDESDQPFFAHVHLLGTHGPKFFPRERIFSAGQRQQISKDPFKVGLTMVRHHQLRTLDWMGDFYDDSILDLDRYVREIFQHLEKQGKLEDTLIVLTSDHGVVRSSHERLPLIIWFPDNRYTGKVAQNVQRTDIAPTILNFLGLALPEWMEGDSLIGESIDPLRTVFSAGINMKNVGLIDGWWGNARSVAPFYSLGSLSMIHCQIWYFMSLEDGLMTSQEVESHSSPCRDSELLTVPQARKLMVEHLTQRSYEANFLLDGEYQPSPHFYSDESNNPEISISCNDAKGGSKIEVGLCFYELGEFKEALHIFRNASSENPQSELAYNNICASLNNLGDYKKGIEACKQALELKPDYRLAQNNLAWAETELAKARDVAREQEQAAMSKNDVREFNVAAHSFYRIGDYQDSLRCWEKAFVLEPENPANINNVAVALIALKQYERAIEMLEDAVSKAPDKSLYQNNIRWANSLLNSSNE